jgi:TonB family protein
VKRFVWLPVAAFAAWAAVAGAAQDPVAAARALYAQASYEEALAAFDAVPRSARNGREDEVDIYRALCLMALDRPQEAESAMEKVAVRSPWYRLDDERMSPRAVSLYAAVRRRMLPAAIELAYASARRAFDNQQPAAAAGFENVLKLAAEFDAVRAADASGGDPSTDRAMRDIKTLATGFLALMKGGSEPVQPVRDAAAPARAEARSDGTFRAGDEGIVPPVALDETLPPWMPPNPQMRGVAYHGTIEVLIDEHGLVQQVTVVEPSNPSYDATVSAAARRWHYRPALQQGRPVKFRKAVSFTLQPTLWIPASAGKAPAPP